MNRNISLYKIQVNRKINQLKVCTLMNNFVCMHVYLSLFEKYISLVIE